METRHAKQCFSFFQWPQKHDDQLSFNCDLNTDSRINAAFRASGPGRSKPDKANPEFGRILLSVL